MKDKIEHIDKSIDSWYYLSAIEQSKEWIRSNSVTDEYRLEMKKKLLNCIEECSWVDFDNSDTVREILNIFNDNKLLKNLSNQDKAVLYSSLWNNYFSLWNFEMSIDAYYKAFELWNNKIIIKNVFIKILNHFSEKWLEVNLISDQVFSLIMKEIIDKKDEIYYFKTLENDLEELFVWWNNYIENPMYVWEYIYNLELSEYLWNINLSSLYFNWYIEEYNTQKNQFAERLSNWYMDLIEDTNWLDEVVILRENMIKRFSWENIDFEEFSSYLREFISLWFDMIDVFFKLWDSDKWFAVLNFLLELWFTNLSYYNMQFLVDKLKQLVWFWEGYNESVIESVDYEKFNYILSKNLNIWVPLFKWMIDVWDIFLHIWDEVSSFRSYLSASAETGIYIEKIKELLEITLLEKDFSDTALLEGKNSPEMILTFLIKKIEDGLELKEKDLEDVIYVLSL